MGHLLYQNRTAGLHEKQLTNRLSARFKNGSFLAEDSVYPPSS